MFFTQDDYKKIQQWLIKNSVKDTEFNEANIPFNGEETITIVQGNQNKKVFLKDLIAQVFNLGISDFVNITDKYDAPNISLEEAIRLIPSRARKEGQVITFLDMEDHWHIYQFKGVLNQWNVLDTWEDLFDWEKLIIDSTLPDEEDLTKSEPDANGNSYLSLKDRAYNPEDFSGLGRVILRKNIMEVEDPIYGKVKKNILYQDMINKENTIYEIRYDFDLNGEEITIPEGCVLDFQGGKFYNGTIKGNDCTVNRTTSKILNNIKVYNVVNLFPYNYEDNELDDSILQSCLYKKKVIDLENYEFIINNSIQVNSDIIIRNAILKIKSNVPGININVDNLHSVDSVELHNVTIDGSNISDTGINAFYTTNIRIENCRLFNYKEIESGSRGILFRRCSNVIVLNTTINDIEAFPNGVIGDSQGSCRAIALQNSKNVLIKNCTIYNIISAEDGDAIHFNADNFMEEIEGEIIYSKIVESCYFYNISRSHIKIQDKWVVVKDNTMINDIVSSDAVIRVYANDCIILNNRITYKCAYGVNIGIDKNIQVKRVKVCDNYLQTTGYTYQGAIFLYSPTESCVIEKNNIIINDSTKSDLYGIYIREDCSNLQIISNNFSTNAGNASFICLRGDNEIYYKISNLHIAKNYSNGVSKFLWFNNNNGGFEVDTIFAESNFIVMPNKTWTDAAVIASKDVDSILDKIIDRDNSVSTGLFIYRKAGYISHLPTLPDSKIGFEYYTHRETKKRPLYYAGEGKWVDAIGNDYSLKSSGSSVDRPTLDSRQVGFVFFDMTINKPIYWTGSKWVDATGAKV